MTTTPQGWYDDGEGSLRWWDGTEWTAHTQPLGAVTTSVAPVLSATDAVATAPEVDAAPADAAPVPLVLGGAAPTAVEGTAGSVPPVPVAPADVLGAYPGLTPGAVPEGGGFAGATEPKKKSKLWILWVALGLGVVVVVLIIAGLSGRVSAQDAAIATVNDYDEAWSAADCDKYMTATTSVFRTALQLPDCEAFEAAAEALLANADDYEVKVTSTEGDGDEITVNTTETFTSSVDDHGETLDKPVEYEDQYSYILIEVDGKWVIDGARVNGGDI